MFLSIIFQPNPVSLAVIIASISWMSVARLVRAQTLATSELDFVAATKSLGASDTRLIIRHLLPSVLPVVIVAATQTAGQVVLVEAALDFLGLGVKPPEPSLGNMISTAQTYLANSVWVALFPGIVILATVLATNLLGNALRDAFDPRLR